MHVFCNYPLKSLENKIKSQSFEENAGNLRFQGGGGEFQKSFFSILAKNIQNQKKFFKQKNLYFNFGHFGNKSCLILQTLQTLDKKSIFLGSFPPPPHTIFQTKHVGMIPTVQVFCINDFPIFKKFITRFAYTRHKIYCVEVRAIFKNLV